MQTLHKTAAIAEVLAHVAREFIGNPGPAVDEVASRCYDAGFAAAQAETHGERGRARRQDELHLNEIARLKIEIERLRGS